MKLSLYFDIYPWTKESDTIYASSYKDTKPKNSIRYRVNIEIPDPAQPDVIIPAIPIEVTS